MSARTGSIGDEFKQRLDQNRPSERAARTNCMAEVLSADNYTGRVLPCRESGARLTPSRNCRWCLRRGPATSDEGLWNHTASRNRAPKGGRAPSCMLISPIARPKAKRSVPFRRLAKMEQTNLLLPQTGQSGQTTATSQVDRCSETSWFGRRGEISMPSRH
jgi:hypothetical protein